MHNKHLLILEKNPQCKYLYIFNIHIERQVEIHTYTYLNKEEKISAHGKKGIFENRIKLRKYFN
jgi:hypothetical protein